MQGLDQGTIARVSGTLVLVDWAKVSLDQIVIH